jgi:hypothetical protein
MSEKTSGKKGTKKYKEKKLAVLYVEHSALGMFFNPVSCFPPFSVSILILSRGMCNGCV